VDKLTFALILLIILEVNNCVILWDPTMHYTIGEWF